LIPSLSIAVRSPALWLAIFVAALCIALQFAGLAEAWRFDRQAIAQGAWHQLLTGNFVHLGRGHLWMNMTAFVLIVALVWQHFKAWQWFIIIIGASLCVGIGLYLRDPEVIWYVGFSGTLHGLIIAGCFADMKHYPQTAGSLLALTIAKLAWEQFSGPLPSSEATAGGPVVVNSHLYGAIGGAVIALLLLGLQRMLGNTPADAVAIDD